MSALLRYRPSLCNRSKCRDGPQAECREAIVVVEVPFAYSLQPRCSLRLRQHEALNGHALKSNRREECVEMPAKTARFAARPPFGGAGSCRHTPRLSCREVR